MSDTMSDDEIRRIAARCNKPMGDLVLELLADRDAWKTRAETATQLLGECYSDDPEVTRRCRAFLARVQEDNETGEQK